MDSEIESAFVNQGNLSSYAAQMLVHAEHEVRKEGDAVAHVPEPELLYLAVDATPNLAHKSALAEIFAWVFPTFTPNNDFSATF